MWALILGGETKRRRATHVDLLHMGPAGCGPGSGRLGCVGGGVGTLGAPALVHALHDRVDYRLELLRVEFVGKSGS